MIAAWMLYTLAVSAALVVAGLLADRAFRALRWPRRGIWLGVLAATIVLPLGAIRSAQRAPAPAPTSPQPSARATSALPFVLAPNTAGRVRAIATPSATTTRRWARWSVLLATAWGAGAALVALLVAGGTRRLARSRERWERTTIDGVALHVADDAGPAVVGLVRPTIVLPRWMLALDPRDLSLVVAHERQHLLARDPLALGAALATLALLPWNAPLWIVVARLRLAIESDCDARVLRATGDVRRYGRLLVEVAERLRSMAAQARWRMPSIEAATTFGLLDPPRMLESRIHALLTPAATRLTRIRATVLAGLAGACLAAACVAPRPTRSADARLTNSPLTARPDAAAPRIAPVPAPTELHVMPDSQPATAPVRTIVSLTSVGIRGARLQELLVFGTGRVLVGIGGDAPRLLTDTLRLQSVAAITADVTEGNVHLQLVSDSGALIVAGRVTNGPAEQVSASGRHIVLLQGGVGIAPVPESRPPTTRDGIGIDTALLGTLARAAAPAAFDGSVGTHPIVWIVLDSANHVVRAAMGRNGLRTAREIRERSPGAPVADMPDSTPVLDAEGIARKFPDLAGIQLHSFGWWGVPNGADTVSVIWIRPTSLGWHVP